MDCDWWSLGIIMYEVNELCFSSLCFLVGVFNEVASMRSPYLYVINLYRPLFIYHSIYSSVSRGVYAFLCGRAGHYLQENSKVRKLHNMYLFT